jgi:hypothetical protein
VVGREGSRVREVERLRPVVVGVVDAILRDLDYGWFTGVLWPWFGVWCQCCRRVLAINAVGKA